MQLGAGRLVRLAGAVVLLLSGAIGYVVVGAQLYERYQRAYTNYQVAGACGTLITWSPPSYVFTAFYGNQPTFLSVRYRSPQPQPLRLTLSIPQFTQPQSFDVQGTPAFHEQAFKPPLIDPGALDSLVGSSQRDAQIVLQVQSGHQRVCSTSWPTRLESRQKMLWEDAAGSDLSPYLAGWVTPRADVIVSLVGKVSRMRLHQYPAQYPQASALFGYDQGRASREAVIEQVNAILDTLQFVYQMSYVNENLPTEQSNATEIIKLPKDILSTPLPTGMCVETTAIMASAIEAVGMRPFIVIVPQHAFLGVALDASPSAPLEFWETSDLGSGATGHQANIDGDNEYHNRTMGPVLRMIDIQQERQQGIEPIE